MSSISSIPDHSNSPQKDTHELIKGVLSGRRIVLYDGKVDVLSKNEIKQMRREGREFTTNIQKVFEGIEQEKINLNDIEDLKSVLRERIRYKKDSAKIDRKITQIFFRNRQLSRIEKTLTPSHIYLEDAEEKKTDFESLEKGVREGGKIVFNYDTKSLELGNSENENAAVIKDPGRAIHAALNMCDYSPDERRKLALLLSEHREMIVNPREDKKPYTRALQFLAKSIVEDDDFEDLKKRDLNDLTKGIQELLSVRQEIPKSALAEYDKNLLELFKEAVKKADSLDADEKKAFYEELSKWIGQWPRQCQKLISNEIEKLLTPQNYLEMLNNFSGFLETYKNTKITDGPFAWNQRELILKQLVGTVLHTPGWKQMLLSQDPSGQLLEEFERIKKEHIQQIISLNLNSRLSVFEKLISELKPFLEKLNTHTSTKELSDERLSTIVQDLKDPKKRLVIDFHGELKTLTKEEVREAKKNKQPIQTQNIEEVIKVLGNPANIKSSVSQREFLGKALIARAQMKMSRQLIKTGTRFHSSTKKMETLAARLMRPAQIQDKNVQKSVDALCKWSESELSVSQVEGTFSVLQEGSKYFFSFDSVNKELSVRKVEAKKYDASESKNILETTVQAAEFMDTEARIELARKFLESKDQLCSSKKERLELQAAVDYLLTPNGYASVLRSFLKEVSSSPETARNHLVFSLSEKGLKAFCDSKNPDGNFWSQINQLKKLVTKTDLQPEVSSQIQDLSDSISKLYISGLEQSENAHKNQLVNQVALAINEKKEEALFYSRELPKALALVKDLEGLDPNQLEEYEKALIEEWNNVEKTREELENKYSENRTITDENRKFIEQRNFLKGKKELFFELKNRILKEGISVLEKRTEEGLRVCRSFITLVDTIDGEIEKLNNRKDAPGISEETQESLNKSILKLEEFKEEQTQQLEPPLEKYTTLIKTIDKGVEILDDCKKEESIKEEGQKSLEQSIEKLKELKEEQPLAMKVFQEEFIALIEIINEEIEKLKEYKKSVETQEGLEQIIQKLEEFKEAQTLSLKPPSQTLYQSIKGTLEAINSIDENFTS